MKRYPVVVIGGGWSGERGISLRSMDGVFHALRRRGWDVSAIDLQPPSTRFARSGQVQSPRWAKKVSVDNLVAELRKKRGTVAFLALHGPGGEDGRLQGMLDLAGLPYTGSGALASALAMDKAVAKTLMAAAGVPVPGGWLLKRGDSLPKGVKYPVFIKPVAQGSALGVSPAKNAAQARKALAAAWKWDEGALMEPYLKGRELTVAVLGKIALPVVEIVPEHAFYDFHSKYAAGGSRHLCPAPISAAVARKAQAAALKAHQALGCRAFSRSDLILDAKGNVKLLEVNTLPGLTSVSLLPDAAKAEGFSYGQLLEAMLQLSLDEALWRSTKA